MSKKNEAKTDIKINVPVVLKIIESKNDDEKGVVEAYVSIFENVDLVGDIISKGAFAESLAKKLPVGVWSHNWDEPIAKTLIAREDDKGLYIKGQFVEGVQKADEAYRLLKAGVITEFSIGFRVLDDEWREDGVRVIKKAKLYEWSPVLAGANPDTELISVKSDKKDDDQEKDKGETDENVEEEKAEMKRVDFVKTAKGEIKIYYRENGEKKCEVFQVSNKYKKYLQERKAQKKVETHQGGGKATQQKILRMRQASKEAVKAVNYLLRISKD